MIDVAIVALPRLELTRPPIAPAILSSLANELAMTNKIFDFALQLHDRSEKKDWDEFELFWQIDIDYKLSAGLDKKLNLLFDDFVEQVLNVKPRFIAVSVFSHNSLGATNLFLEKIRSRTKAKIIVGGQGIQSKMYTSYPYGEHLKRNNLVDFYCSGEAEINFKKILQGIESGPGINNANVDQIDNLDETPIPNYDGYDLEKYHHLSSGKSFWIDGSRGCVRKCDFCDIGNIWKKFRFKSGKKLAEEMKYQIQNHGIKNFQFCDALINGSMKAFNEMMYTIKSYIDKKEIFRPLIGGHFIVRPPNQMLPEHYETAGRAGLDLISIGVETGSDDLRFKMDKKFTNEDIKNHLDQCKKNNIKNLFLMFAGHPEETLQDHEQTLEMFKEFRYYVASGTITGLEIGTAAILHNTPLAHWAEKNLEMHNDNELRGDTRFWFNPKNPTLTLKERIRRQLELYENAIDHGYPINNIQWRLRYMKKLLLNAKNQNWKY